MKPLRDKPLKTSGLIFTIMPEGPVCKDCMTFKRFKDKCWFYWDNKKACSNFLGSEFAEPTFKEVKECDFAAMHRGI